MRLPWQDSNYEFDGLNNELQVDSICCRFNIKKKTIFIFLKANHTFYWLSEFNFKFELGNESGWEVSGLTCWIGFNKNAK